MPDAQPIDLNDPNEVHRLRYIAFRICLESPGVMEAGEAHSWAVVTACLEAALAAESRGGEPTRGDQADTLRYLLDTIIDPRQETPPDDGNRLDVIVGLSAIVLHSSALAAAALACLSAERRDDARRLVADMATRAALAREEGAS